MIMKVTVITPRKTQIIEVNEGQNLLEGLRDRGIIIPADCGGRGTCGKCSAKLVSGNIDADIKNGYFNCCQGYIKEDVSIELPDYSGTAFFAAETKGEYQTDGADGFGLAVDIGTTSVAAYLCDLKNGKVTDGMGELNRQIGFGADVLSRISASGKHLQTLCNIINAQIEDIKKRFCIKHGISGISKTVICGNNTMLHLLLGRSPQSMGQAPFTPLFTSAVYNDNYITLPSASAYIGSDIVAGALACGMFGSSENALLIDIGTNGEILLKHNGKYYAASAAAGPALEGGNIECGMGGAAGAIDHVYYSGGSLTYTTIGGGEAKGICGSGLVDLISILLKTNVVDISGRLDGLGTPLSERIRDARFYITDKVYLSQKDIREYQLAKSAIHSATEVLLIKAGCDISELSKVYLAGGLAYHLDRQSAAHTGLIPCRLKDKTITVGNAAGKGAIMCLLKEKLIGECGRIADIINVTELDDGLFYELFIKNMSF